MIYKDEQYSMEIDIISDSQELAYNMFVNAGLKNVSMNHALHQYYDIQLRILEPKPRQILISKEFSCPELCKEGYECFKQMVMDFKFKLIQSGIRDYLFRIKQYGLFFRYLYDNE